MDDEVQVDVGALDWEAEAWLKTYYPQDLPEDWKAAYYANEYRCAGAVWSPTRLADWDEGLPEDFALWLIGNESALGPDDLHRAWRALGRRLSGVWAVSPDTAAAARELGLAAVEAAWEADRANDWAGFGIYRADATLDLRAARRWLEAFGAAPGPQRRQALVAGTPAQVEQLRSLAGLLGF